MLWDEKVFHSGLFSHNGNVVVSGSPDGDIITTEDEEEWF